MKLITVDGERFELTLPTRKVWSTDFVLTAKKLHKDGIWKEDYGSLLVEIDGMEHLVGRTNVAPYTFNGPEEASEIFGWRPMLVPPDPVADVNGAITTGGSFYLDGAPQSTETRALRFMPGQKLTVGNTVEGKELHWVVWDGKLICTQVVVYHLSHRDLDELGLDYLQW